MKLPDEIPKRLRNLAIVLKEFDDGEGAWFKADAVAVIESLKGTTVSISNIMILIEAPDGYMPSGLRLFIERFPNEADTDYAERSHAISLNFIRDSETINDKTLFALKFSLEKKAA